MSLRKILSFDDVMIYVAAMIQIMWHRLFRVGRYETWLRIIILTSTIALSELANINCNIFRIICKIYLKFFFLYSISFYIVLILDAWKVLKNMFLLQKPFLYSLLKFVVICIKHFNHILLPPQSY